MASGTISTGSVSRLLQEGVSNVFGNSLTEHPIQYDKIFEVLTSKKAFEVAVQLEGFGPASQKDEGDDITFDSRQQGYAPKYVHLAWAKGYHVTREALDDELFNQLKEGAKALGRSMRVTKEINGADVLNNGFAAGSIMLDGDGSALFSTTHSSGPSGGTYSNRLAVDADLSEAALEDMLVIISTMEDARGLPMALQAQRLIVASSTNQFEAQRIMGSVLQNDTGNNATNATRDMNSVRDGFTVNNYLLDTDAWFVTTDAPHGLKYYSRIPVEFDQDNAFTSKNARFSSYERYSFGWDDARGVVGSQGA